MCKTHTHTHTHKAHPNWGPAEESLSKKIATPGRAASAATGAGPLGLGGLEAALGQGSCRLGGWVGGGT